MIANLDFALKQHRLRQPKHNRQSKNNDNIADPNASPALLDRHIGQWTVNVDVNSAIGRRECHSILNLNQKLLVLLQMNVYDRFDLG